METTITITMSEYTRLKKLSDENKELQTEVNRLRYDNKRCIDDKVKSIDRERKKMYYKIKRLFL
jgi:hypothetical protein